MVEEEIREDQPDAVVWGRLQVNAALEAGGVGQRVVRANEGTVHALPFPIPRRPRLHHVVTPDH